MKKILLSLAFAAFGLTVNSYAQTIMSQTFGSPTVAPALPATWSQGSTGTTAWHTSTGGTGGGSTWGGLTGANNVPTTHGQFVIVDDAADPTQLHDTLKSPVFSMGSYSPSTVYLSYDYFFYNATNNSSGITETAYVIGSTNGGSTWAIIDTVQGNAWTVNAFSTRYASLSSLSGATCMIGFVYSDGGGAILGCALNNVQVYVPPANDITLTAVTPAATPTAFYQTGGNATFGGTMYNIGSTTITSFVAGYKVGAGSPVTSTISGISVAPFTTYNFTVTTPYVVASGSQTATIWVNEPGGAAPTSADTMTTAIVGVDSLQPKKAMIEEFNQASCDPCADAAPNVDSVYANNVSNSVIVRYHVNWPGRDCMDSVTLSPFVQGMITYYGVNSVPWANLDGISEYPGYGGEAAGYLCSYTVQSESVLGSPFKITITPTFNAHTNTYSFSAVIKSYAAMPAGLVARAALTVDTITYALNQSTETISQTLFPQVAENMFPSSAGTTLTAFTSGSSQTVTGTWTKNHPWGSNRSVWAYDSTTNGQIVVWVMDNTAQYVYQAAAVSISTILGLGVNSVTGNNGSLNVYPNPASSTATVALNLTSSADVKMEVYNVLGQLVYNMPVENRNAGISNTIIDISNFANGNYFVKVSIGNEVLTKNLTITK